MADGVVNEGPPIEEVGRVRVMRYLAMAWLACVVAVNHGAR